MKRVVSALLCGVLASGSTFGVANDREITQLISNYEEALNSSDVSAVMLLYGKTPTFMPQHMTAQIGREAVKQAYESVFKTIKLNVQFTVHDCEIVGDTAWVRTSSAGKTKILAHGVEVTEGNNELFILKKENGDWKIHRYLFATSQSRQ